MAKHAKAQANGKTEAKREAAYFLSLSLENVRCFGPKQTLDLSDGNGKPARWTIILGLNGTGKTTLLQSLVGFETIEDKIGRDGQGGNGDALPPRFFNHYLSSANLQRDADLKLKLDCKIASSNSLFLNPSKILQSSYERVQRSGMGKTDCYSKLWCCAYGAGRRVGTISLAAENTQDSIETLLNDKAELRNPEEWLLRLDYSSKEPSLFSHDQEVRLSEAIELLIKVLPDIEDIRLTSTSGPNPQPRAEFKTPYGWVPLRQLGYGYQTLITWVADLANRMAERYPDSPNPLAEPAVVLVDEIDLHLHPQWQRKLIGYLTERFPNTQFIATAHSPLVVQAAADANLAVLRREGDHVIIDNDVDNIRGWRIDQILTSELFGLETARPPHVEKLLLERKAILTKSKPSPADKKRLKELESEIGELPQGETVEERKERQRLLELLERLEHGKRPSA